jgi:ribonucleoside-triphosphate reductase
LKTFGGRASGPEPLVDLFKFTVDLFKNAAGRKLSSIECHDLCCKIAQIVVVGGVRRSALISLSNLTDDRIRRAKHGSWWETHAHRGLANNSACYTEKPDFEAFLNEWVSLYESRSGERGMFSRVASQKQAAKNGRRDPEWDFGTNPCSEIILRPNQFCNLSEVVVRPSDTYETLLDKVEIATIIGTLQATLTDFRYLRAVWKRNTEEEALLGC